MENLEIETQVRIRADFTAGQWELYSSLPGVEAVAEELNAELTRLVNEGWRTKAEVRSAMYKLMSKHARMGAADSEPCWFLESVLERIWVDQEA